MNNKKAKHLYKKNGFWFVRYKDPVDKNWKGISTGLKDLEKNFNQAKIYRDEFLENLKKIETFEIKEGTIEEAFDRFKELNSSKSEATKVTYEYFFEYLKKYIDVKKPCLVFNKIEQ